MKATNRYDFWRAIAFLVLSFSLTGCFDSCNEPLPPLAAPVVNIIRTDNITAKSATLVMMISSKDSVSVSFSYTSNNSDWKTIKLPGKFYSSDEIKVTYDLFDLKPNTDYQFKGEAANSAGATPSIVISFYTSVLPKSIIKLGEASDITKTSAKLIASVIPMQDVKVAFKYRVKNTTWQENILPSSFSGTDSVKVSFDLSDLQLNTDYEFCLETRNSDNEVVSVSDVRSFKTYAVSDYDGNLYHTVAIGNQTWLQENLKTTHYANGDPIDNVTNLNTWGNLTTAAYCWYNNKPEIGKVYGALYNWYVGADPRGLIVGWHTPTFEEFLALSVGLDNSGKFLSGIMLMEAGNEHWDNTSRVATNSSGFTAIPNGHIDPNVNSQYVFEDLRGTATFWGVSVFGEYANRSHIENNVCVFSFNGYGGKQAGCGLRLIKDN